MTPSSPNWKRRSKTRPAFSTATVTPPDSRAAAGLEAPVTGPLRVLGVDTSLRCSGLAVVERVGGRLSVLYRGVVKSASGSSVATALARLHEETGRLIETFSPGEAAIEGIFFCKNVRTAVTLGEARGVVIAACARASVPVFEYAPRRVKQGLVGRGAAGKEQVRRMVMALLGMTDEPTEDEADALAIALCHINQRRGITSAETRRL